MKKFDELRQEGYSAKTGGHEWGTDKGTQFAKKTTPGEVAEGKVEQAAAKLVRKMKKERKKTNEIIKAVEVNFPSLDANRFVHSQTNEAYKVPKNYAAMMAKKRKKAGTSEFGSHPDKKKEVKKEEVEQIDEAKLSDFAKEIGIPAIAQDMAYHSVDISDTRKITNLLKNQGMSKALINNPEFMTLLAKHLGVSKKGFSNLRKSVSKFKKEEVDLDEGRAQDMQQKVKDKIDSKFHNMYDFKKVKDSDSMYNMLSMAKRRKHLKEGVGEYTAKLLKKTPEFKIYDIMKGGEKVGVMKHHPDSGSITGKLHGKDLPDLGGYKYTGSGPQGKLHGFLKSKTGQKFNEEVDLDENYRAARAQSNAANKMYGRTSDSDKKKTMSKADIFKALDKKYGDPKKKTGIYAKEEVELDEKKLTPAELKKREEIAKAIEKDQPDMPMDKKMAIATAQAKKAVEAKMYDSGWRKTTGPKKDKFGNTIKDKNRPKNLAKQGMSAVRKEDAELKTFSAIREAAGKVVFKGKMKKVPVEIHKTSKGYVAMVDGDELDTYKSEKDAKKGIEVAIKELT